MKDSKDSQNLMCKWARISRTHFRLRGGECWLWAVTDKWVLPTPMPPRCFHPLLANRS